MKKRYELFIDTTRTGVITVRCGSRSRTVAISREQHSSRKLLPLINASLSQQGITLSKLTGIGVVSGPGPFTAIRVGVATANTLGFVLGIPVVGIRATNAKTFATFVLQAQKKLVSAKRFTPVAPYYGRPPHITKAKPKRYSAGARQPN